MANKQHKLSLLSLNVMYCQKTVTIVTITVVTVFKNKIFNLLIESILYIIIYNNI